MQPKIKMEIELEIRERLDGQKNIEAVIAMGSCARDEETYFTNASGRTEMLSDYEMLIVVHDLSNTEPISQVLMGIRSKFQARSSSPCFDIEWSYKSISEVRRLDRRFIFFEAKESGHVIYGNKDIFSQFPDITVNNLNYSELNTVILHRLYHVLRDCSIADEHYQKYLIARNTLDIPTAVLPLMGYLEGSYRKRNLLFRRTADKTCFPDEFLDRLDNYLRMKLDYSSDLYDCYDLKQMKLNFLMDFQVLYSFQKQHQNGIAFRRSTRQMLSGFYRCKPGRIYEAIIWPKKMTALCDKMFSCLENGCWDAALLADIRNEMEACFGYQ